MPSISATRCHRTSGSGSDQAAASEPGYKSDYMNRKGNNRRALTDEEKG